MRKNSLALSIISLLLIFTIVTFRGDSLFPFSSATSELIVISFAALGSLGLLTLLAMFFCSPQFFTNTRLFQARLPRSPYMAIILVTMLVVWTTVLFYKNYLTFKDIYTDFNFAAALAVAAIAILVVCVPLFLRKPGWSLAGLFVASFILACIPIAYFPITARVADLMPIVQKQTEALAKGQSIYQYFLLDNGVFTQAVRQPGMSVSYLPAYWLSIDFRFLSVAYTLLTGLVLAKFAFPNFKKLQFTKEYILKFSAIALILLSPYWLNRLDLYEPIFWLLLCSALFLLYKGKYTVAALFWGLGIFVQVWFWLFTPFFLLYILRERGWRQVVISSLCLLIGVIPLAAFALSDFPTYNEHVFGFYKNVIAIKDFSKSTFYLTPVLLKAELGRWLTPIQGALALSVLGWFWKSKNSFKGLLLALSFVLFMFIQFNSLSWNYMYLNLILLLVISLGSLNIDDISEPKSEARTS